MNLESDYLEGEDDGEYGMDFRHLNTKPIKKSPGNNRKSKANFDDYNLYLIEQYNSRTKK